jgi:hypothetical protein
MLLPAARCPTHPSPPLLGSVRGRRYHRAFFAAGRPTVVERPDKQEIRNEIWTEGRIRAFLDKAPLGPGEDPDYSALLYAYRSMRPEDFAVFVDLFVAAGRNLNARGRLGVTLLETIATHRHAAPFREIVEARLPR